MGEIVALDLGTGATRFDPNVEEPHHHLVCRACGKVRDLSRRLPGLSRPRGRRRQGSKWAIAEVVFRGLCVVAEWASRRLATGDGRLRTDRS